MQKGLVRKGRMIWQALAVLALSFFAQTGLAQEMLEIELYDAAPTIELIGADMNRIVAMYDEEVVYDADTRTLEVVWKSSEETMGVLLVGTDSTIPNLLDTETFGYDRKVLETMGEATEHHVAVSGLTPNTTYYVRTMANGSEAVPSFGREYAVYTGVGNGVSCQYIEEALGPGKQNDVSEVIKLQSFLAAFEGAALPISGVYDTATKQAVQNFQTKYAEYVLAPWGLANPTGFVGITTKNAINDIYCGLEISLSDAQLFDIEEILIEETIAYVVPEMTEPEEVAVIDEDEYTDESVAIYEEDETSTTTDAETEDKVVIAEPEITVEPIATTTEDIPAGATTSDEILTEATSTDDGSDEEMLVEATTTDEDVLAEATSTEEEKDSLLLGKYQAVGPAMGSSAGVKQLAAITVGYIDQYSLPILIVLVILLLVQLVLLWRTPVEEEEELLRSDF